MEEIFRWTSKIFNPKIDFHKTSSVNFESIKGAMDTTSDGYDGSGSNLAVATEYNNVYGVAERSCCDDDIVILICSVDITSPIAKGTANK